MMKDGTVSGAVAVVSGRFDRSLRPIVGIRRSRGLEAQFTARASKAVQTAVPPVAEESEMRILARALDGVFISWIGAINRDGDIEERTPAGVRDFVNQRWGMTIAVDSVAIRGDDLWVRLKSRATGAVCSQGMDDLRPMCQKSGWRRA